MTKKSTGGKTAKTSTYAGFLRKLNLTNTHTAFPPLPIWPNFSYFYKKFGKAQLLQKKKKKDGHTWNEILNRVLKRWMIENLRPMMKWSTLIEGHLSDQILLSFDFYWSVSALTPWNVYPLLTSPILPKHTSKR